MFGFDNPLELLFNFVVWVFVPLVLLIVLRFVHTGHTRTEDPRHRSAIRSGYYAGVVLSLMLLTYQVSGFISAGFPKWPIYRGFDLWLALSGAVVSIFIRSTVRKLSPRHAGATMMLMTFVALSALFNYLFVRTFNDTILSLALGMTFGVLAHRAVVPAAFRDFLKS